MLQICNTHSFNSKQHLTSLFLEYKRVHILKHLTRSHEVKTQSNLEESILTQNSIRLFQQVIIYVIVLMELVDMLKYLPYSL